MRRRKFKCQGENPNVEEEIQMWRRKPKRRGEKSKYGGENSAVEEKIHLGCSHLHPTSSPSQ